MRVDVAVLSRQGGRARNEDACGYWTCPEAGCWVVSDGAGGHGGGDVAARTVVSSILSRFSAAPDVSAAFLAALMRSANADVLSGQGASEILRDMRATVTVLLIDCRHEIALWGHIGDSRVYGFRGDAICFQSRDHSVMQSMVDAGHGSADVLRTHPQRGVLLHALGTDAPLPFDPESRTALSLHDGDAFLLCTDGLWEGVIEDAMIRTLHVSGDARSWLDALESELLRKTKLNRDNYSAIAVRVHQVGDATRISTR